MSSTVAIVAQERDMRERCTELLRSGGFDVAASTESIFELPPTADAVVIIVGRSSEATALLAQAAPLLRGCCTTAVLSIVNRQVVRRALRSGVAAVVRENAVDDALVPAVRSACAGQLSIPLDFAAALEKPILSAREKQILGMVVMGFTNGEVARRLYLAESTVKSHMSSIFVKLGVGSRKEAAALVLDPEQGLGLGILSISEAPADHAEPRFAAGVAESAAA